ncbi:MAG TPA: MbnP family protein, partial [Luteolibacter sp.]
MKTAFAAMLALASPVVAASLEITVEPVFNGEPLRLDSLLRYETAAGETLSFTRLSYLLGGVALERNDGQWVEIPDSTAWMDAATKRDSILLENVPDGSYRALRFHIGLDADANAADVSKIPANHPLNPNLNGLHWSWQGGYIFMAVEGRFRGGTSGLMGFAHHLAREPNRTRINLNVSLDLKQDAGVMIRFDLANLFNAPRPLSFAKDGATTHSREGDPVSAALVSNLRGAFSVSKVVSNHMAVRALAPVTPIDLPDRYTPYRFTMSRAFPVPDLPRD